jgi:tripartite-type tricarboxylate transporter receptor subunit TctC
MKKTSTVILIAAGILCSGIAHAQQPFYRGKTVTIISGASGGYDAYAHLLANHMKKYIAGTPTLIAKNMPGAASMLAANYLYNVAAPDGLTFGGFVRTIPMAPLMGNKAAKYQPEKFTWIGSSSRYLDDAYLLMVNKSLGITSLEQLRSRKEPLRLGSTGPSSQTDEGARIIRDVMGLNMQIIRGYQTTPQIMLAVERGEVDGIMIGISSMNASKPEWLEPDSSVNFLVQFGYGGEGRHSAFPNVPRIDEFAKTADDKAIFDLLQLPFKVSRPFAGPPDMPADLTRILRDAFMRTHEDPQYLADAKKMGLDVSAMSGEDAAKIIAEAASLPADLMKRYSDMLAKAD